VWKNGFRNIDENHPVILGYKFAGRLIKWAFGINMDGAFDEYTAIPEEATHQGNLMVLPKNISPAEAVLNEPLSCVYNGFQKCYVKPGDTAIVVGAGPIGLLHVMLLKMAGVIMVDESITLRLYLKTKKSFRLTPI